MLQLFLGALLVIIISALSSVLEAALYSLPVSHIDITKRSHKRIGRILMDLKKDIHRPITAILTINTIARTCLQQTTLTEPLHHTKGTANVFSPFFWDIAVSLKT
jgi:CBS domain containing-hemolysin-like protein